MQQGENVVFFLLPLVVYIGTIMVQASLLLVPVLHSQPWVAVSAPVLTASPTVKLASVGCTAACDVTSSVASLPYSAGRLIPSTLKLGAEISSETLAKIYQTTWRHI
jgi:hypothetical protein